MQGVSAEEAVVARHASAQMGILTMPLDLEVERLKMGDVARLQRGHQSHWKHAQ